MDPSFFGKAQKKENRAIVYIRVSSEEQVENYSLATQEDICLKEAARRKLDIIQIFREEGKSAKTIQGRPMLIQMLEYCRKHKKEIDSVIVYRLDRISRQTADYLIIRKKLAESNINLISATEPTGNSPTEKFVETMLAGFAQMDNDVRGERSRNGLRARFMSGLPTSFAPFGYLNQNGYVVKDPKSFDALQKAWEIYSTGTKSLREIAKMLNEQGVRVCYRSGKEFKIKAQTVQRMFRNKFYTGKLVSAKYGQEVQGQHIPMVTEELFYRVQAILDGRNVNIAKPLAKKNRDNPEFPLRRIVKCSGCGFSLTAGWSKGKNERFAYYFCQKWCGKGHSVPVAQIETETDKLLASVSLTPEALELVTVYLRKTYYKRVAALQKRREDADDELKKLYETRQTLIEKNLAGIYSDDIFREQNRLLEDKITAIQMTKNDDLITKYNIENVTTFIKEKFKDLVKTFANSDLQQRRMILCSIFPSGLVWNYPGYLNTQLSPCFTFMKNINPETVIDGRGGRT
ncbi:MAG TPA: recombinase family protein [bacterium]|nr:recombinase family protein [bacterium]